MSPFWSSLPFFNRAEDAIERRLKAAPMFQELSDRAIREVRDACHLREYKSGEHVFREDEPGVGMYVILEGTVEIYRKGSKGKEWHFAELEEGDFFGELALLEELPRTASAMARTPARILGFFRPDLLSIVERKPRIGVQIMMNMARLISQRLLHANSQLERLTADEIQSRGRTTLRKSMWQDKK